MPDKVREYKDNVFKAAFDEPELFSQFLDMFSPVDELKGLPPEAIEDITERFLPLNREATDCDTVKRIRLPNENGGEAYVISLIEHESSVNYRMPIKLLEYMSLIWSNYESEQNQLSDGIASRKGFKLPPIIPIVFYGGEARWTAARKLSERVMFADTFAEYTPSFKYELVELEQHSIGELAKDPSYMGFILILAKLKTTEEFRQLENMLPKGYLDDLEKKSSRHLRAIVRNIFAVHMANHGMTREEIDDTLFGKDVKGMLSVYAENVRKEKEELRKQVHAEGRAESRREIATVMYQNGESRGMIMKYTNLSDEEYAKIVEEYGIRPEDSEFDEK